MEHKKDKDNEIMYNSIALCDAWMSKMNEDKKISGIPHSMLIFKRNSRQESVAIETNVIMAMRPWSGAINFSYLRYRVKEDYMIFSLDSFFEWANPQFYKDMYDGKFTRS